MPWQFQVPTLDDQQSAEALKEHILTSEPNANVDIDPQVKRVTVSSRASKETFKQLIVAAGHKVDAE